jgi:hypothetical protein
MAFNTTEIRLITHTIAQLKESYRDRVINVLCLGNPDLLITKEQAEDLLGKPITDRIKMRPDWKVLAEGHRLKILEQGVYDSPSFFEAMGVTFTAFDFHAHAGYEEIVDFNYPLPDDFTRTYDLVLDPGTTEHIFNVATCMANICRLTSIGGYIYHSTPMIFPNHGFYSFSPTFYVDFYEKNGFEIVQLAFWHGKGADEHGLCVALRPSPRVDIIFPADDHDDPGVTANSVLVRRLVDKQVRYPSQRIYGGP